RGEQVGYASTADISEDGIASVMARARANASVAEPDPAGARLPDTVAVSAVEGLCHPALGAMPLSAKVTAVRDLAGRVTSLDPRVQRIDTAQWRDEHTSVAVVSTRGVRAAHSRGFAELWSDALGADQWGAASDYGYWWGRDPDAADPEQIAAEAVSRTTRLLGPQSPAPVSRLLLLDPAVSAVLLDAVGRGLTGGALGSGRSPFAGRRGERVGPSILGLVDDGRYQAAPAAAACDDEAVPRRRTALIEAGMLTGALHSTATAAATATSSTGNARRSSHKASPRVAASTLRLAATEPVESLLGGLDDAICVQQLTGAEVGISAVAGRISVGGIGYRLRGGEPAGRLPTLPVAATLTGFLTGIMSVGDDARVIPDRGCLAPTVLWQL
ncbi:MAG: metallopeptidase TldD-related protein, partial [Actinomycetota bacterium]|nr:metallopeptidase TldD-related protein [Actinomycetota bacterium]